MFCVRVSNNGRNFFCFEPWVVVYDDACNRFVVEVELYDFTHVYTSICGISLSMGYTYRGIVRSGVSPIDPWIRVITRPADI
ncbi:MAG: hypothetical protein ACKPKO_05810, partial [Candidatus Fonsibacter sp.]